MAYLYGEGVVAHCPNCNALVRFNQPADRGGDFVSTEKPPPPHSNAVYRFLVCSGCNRAGVALLHIGGGSELRLARFWPNEIPTTTLPRGLPNGIEREYREAELCASSEAWRGASALVRSVLEKTLKANGYTKGSLEDKIDQAAVDGVITEARKKRAHDDIRVLGNEVVHDEWRQVTAEEVEVALRYAQRILEDLYDDRAEVEKILIGRGRIAQPKPLGP